MPKGRSGLPYSKTLREISEHYKQTPAFGVRWEAERHTAFLRRKSERRGKSAVVASLCRRSPKYYECVDPADPHTQRKARIAMNASANCENRSCAFLECA